MGDYMTDMHIKVTLLSRFQEHAGQLQEGHIRVPQGTTALELAVRLGIPQKYVVILLINGKQGAPADVLHSGDHIVYAPPAIGGG